MSVTVNETYGFWEGGGHDNHLFDQPLACELLNFFNSIDIKSVVDFGCGTGDYTKFFISNNINCEGYGGNPNTPEVSGGVCKVLNLAHTVNLDKKFDCVLSLEVGEHLPKEYEDIFIQNLITHSKGLIVLSWATPGQDGAGHFNEQSNEYITEKFLRLGYTRQHSFEMPLRNSSQYWWFKHSLMVFVKVHDI